MNRKRSLTSTAILFALLLLASSCSSSGDALIDRAMDQSSTAEQASPAVSAADDDGESVMSMPMSDEAAAAAPTEAATTTGSAANQAFGQLPETGREIVYTADLALGTTDVTAATREAIRAIEIRGGYLFTQDTAGGVNGYSTLVFKVPPEQFQAALSDLGSVGSVRSQSVNAEDVTAVVVDLDSRIKTAEASVLRLKGFLDDATDITIIALLEDQLLERETSLEQLRGRLRMVRNQVDFATITVRVTELLNHPGVTLQLASYRGHDGGFACLDTPRATAANVGEAFTLCWLVTNVGDTPLAGIAVSDPAIASLSSELLIVDGNADQLAPGEVLVLAHEFEAQESIRIRSRVEATPLAVDETLSTAVGNTAAGDPIGAVSRNMRLDVSEVDEGGLPGFGEVLSDSWNALRTAAIFIALVLVAVAPFLIVTLPLGWVARRVLRRWRTRTAERKAANQPPPPVAKDKLPTETTADADNTVDVN